MFGNKGGKKEKMLRFTKEEVKQLKKMHDNGATLAELGKMYNVHATTIGRALRREKNFYGDDRYYKNKYSIELLYNKIVVFKVKNIHEIKALFPHMKVDTITRALNRYRPEKPTSILLDNVRYTIRLVEIEQK